MVEPLAIGLQAATRARIKPGDVALVTGAGPIGILTALSALAGGCARVYISDIVECETGRGGAIWQHHPRQRHARGCGGAHSGRNRGLGRGCRL